MSCQFCVICQPTTDNRQPTTDNRQPTTDNRQPTTDNEHNFKSRKHQQTIPPRTRGYWDYQS